MNKKETISLSQMSEILSNRYSQFPRKTIKSIVADFLSIVQEQLLDGSKVRLYKIGTFEVKDRAERVGRNPQTGESMVIPESKKLSFRASKSIKELIESAKT